MILESCAGTDLDIVERNVVSVGVWFSSEFGGNLVIRVGTVMLRDMLRISLASRWWVFSSLLPLAVRSCICVVL